MYALNLAEESSPKLRELKIQFLRMEILYNASRMFRFPRNILRMRLSNCMSHNLATSEAVVSKIDLREQQ